MITQQKLNTSFVGLELLDVQCSASRLVGMAVARGVSPCSSPEPGDSVKIAASDSIPHDGAYHSTLQATFSAQDQVDGLVFRSQQHSACFKETGCYDLPNNRECCQSDSVLRLVTVNFCWLIMNFANLRSPLPAEDI